MASFEVDYRQIDKTIDEINSYISNINTRMVEIDREMLSLRNTWQGEDYDQTMKQWLALKGKDSSTQKMIDALNNYASALRSARKMYSDAQTTLYESANRLCKW